MSPAQRLLIVACCARAAELWAAGRIDLAERWAQAAYRYVDGHEYVDEDREADR